MTASQTPLQTAIREANRNVPSGEKADGKYRAPLTKLLLCLAVAAVLAVGGWGLYTSLGAQVPPARIGEIVEVPGGYLRVDRVTPEHMAPMQMDKFAASGMDMSGMGMEMAPAGQRRFTVDVTLMGEWSNGLAYSPEQFLISAKALEESGPIRDKLEAGTVPRNSAVSGSLVFEVPEDAEELMLSFDEGHPISLDLSPVEEGHSHGSHSHGSQTEGDEHDH